MIQSNMQSDIHYRIIQGFYGDRKAERANIPLMNHIDEGLIVLDKLGSPLICKQAYCLHPVLQLNENLFPLLEDEYHIISECDSRAVILAMEYRHQLNKYSSKRIFDSILHKGKLLATLRSTLIGTPYLRYCAVADKVQNRKDFLKYHYGTHERSDELHEYFGNWIYNILGLSDENYDDLVSAINCNDVSNA